MQVESPAPLKPSDESAAPADILIATSREIPMQSYPVKPSQIPDAKKLGENKHLLVKSTRFGGNLLHGDT